MRMDTRPVDKIRNPYLYWLSHTFPLEIARLIISFMRFTPRLTIREGGFPYWSISLQTPIRTPDPPPNWAEGYSYTPGRRFMDPDTGRMILW